MCPLLGASFPATNYCADWREGNLSDTLKSVGGNKRPLKEYVIGGRE